jgi:hypothetical protein
MTGDNSLTKFGKEGTKRDRDIGWRDILGPKSLGCCYFKRVKGLVCLYDTCQCSTGGRDRLGVQRSGGVSGRLQGRRGGRGRIFSKN